MPSGAHLYKVDAELVPNYLDLLGRCLDDNLPPIVTEILLAVAADESIIPDAIYYWRTQVWRSHYRTSIEQLLSDYLDLNRCATCQGFVYLDDLTSIDDELMCSECAMDWEYCDRCDRWWWHGEEECPKCGCDCGIPHPHFTFPFTGVGTVSEDESFELSLPASGTISETGIEKIALFMLDHTLEFRRDGESVNYYSLDPWIRKAQREIGPKWQAKRGNYTRRLSSAMHKMGITIPPNVLTEIGNIARSYTDSSAPTLTVEFTRQLNNDAVFFFHSDSCWFTNYAWKSMCALKAWGGLAMRTLDDNGEPTGRAWVQPLDADNEPTHDTMCATSYLVYNCYGELQNYVAARIVAHLTGRTYRKVNYRSAPMYINGNMAYLVSSQEVCDNTSSIHHDHDVHERF